MKQHHKKFISAKLIMTVLYMSTGFGYIANASSLGQVSDTLSNSGTNVLANHTVNFSISESIPIGGYIDVTLPPAFGTILDFSKVICPLNATSSLENANRTVRCTAEGLFNAPTSIQINIFDVTNAATAGSYPISISTHLADNTLLQDTNAQVAITERVSVFASVMPSLTFVISPVDSNNIVNGATTTLSSATTTLNYGKLQFGSSSIMAQGLTVLTNAAWGFIVSVQQDQDLTSANGASIHAFKDGNSSLIAQNWATPGSDLTATSTFGHFGVTSDDDTLAGGFGVDQWKGFSGGSPLLVMSHNGPVAGQLRGVGTTTVAFRLEVSPLQQAGDYTNVLTYTCTPTF
jgi:hypothetical protein